jgi:hypothetical protein
MYCDKALERVPLTCCRSAGDGEGAAQGLAAGAWAAASPMSRARSSPESSLSGGSAGSSPEAVSAAAAMPVRGLLLGSGAPTTVRGGSDGGSSFVLAASRLPDVPAVLPGWGMATAAAAGVSSVAADAAALAEQSGGPLAVDRAEPPGALPVNAVAGQQTLQAQQVPHRLLPPLSPASSPQLRRNTSSSTAASIDSRGMGHLVLKCCMR